MDEFWFNGFLNVVFTLIGVTEITFLVELHVL